MRGEDRLIIALDTPSLCEAKIIVDELEGTVKLFKVGLELFVSAGKTAVEMLKDAGKDVFLDLKLHDIPNTVRRAALAAFSLDIKMFTVHASGGALMVRAAAEAASFSGMNPLVLAVTVLTHLDERALKEELGVCAGVKGHVLALARRAVSAGAGGVVCSPREISILRENLGPETVIVTPGIRPEGSGPDDQARVCSPEAAVSMGADYIVAGRPVTTAPDRKKAAESILRSIDGL